MFYVLSESIALRSWQFVPQAYYFRDDPFAHWLSDEEFKLLLLCDGEHDIEPSELTESLESRSLIRKCGRGEKMSEWSRHKSYPHRYFPKINLMITGKCNFNCLHCFNAADNAPLMTEWDFDELVGLLDQASDCGIHSFTITGGEPMLHPRFMDIVREIYKRDMFIDELNTNGYFITQEILDEFNAVGCRPMIKISFDGIGCHDWMRDRKGAEARTLDAIELCTRNGFNVMSQTQVHRRNLDSLMPTARKLNDIGVSTMRLIRTTEAPRWEKNSPGSCLGIEEYYAVMLDFMRAYKDSGMQMNVIAWQLMSVYPADKTYSLASVMFGEDEYKPSAPVCKGVRGMVGVTSGGDVIPCLQMSGYFEEHGIHMGNLHSTPLAEFLRDGFYQQTACTNVHKRRKNNSKCDACKYFKYCGGGCPALGLLFAPEEWNIYGSDVTKCLFFENGWYHKTEEAMKGWTNLSSINI